MSQPPRESQRSGGTPGDRARRFIDALGHAEATGSADELVALFADRAELRSLVHDDVRVGIDGARRFWSEYLGSFRQLRSRFARVLEAGDLLVLEWITDGTTRSGVDVSYQGVSIIEFEGDRVARFCTYYDSAALAGRDRPAHSLH